MLFASHTGDAFLSIIAVVAIWAHFTKKWLAKNPEVTKTANDAAKHTALSLITRVFRR